MPLRLPIGAVTPEVTDRWLEMGYRRSGDLVYRAECPRCNECKPTRLNVHQFCPTRSMRRILNRGDRELSYQWGPPQIDAQRVRMFNDHRSGRDLASSDERVTADSYRSFLADTCCDTRELAVCFRDELIAVAIVDVGAISVSAVYTHFDPAASRYSLGTYAILKQIQWAQETHRQYVYLGMYVADNEHLNYKVRFQPQQRLLGTNWVSIEPD